MNVDSMFTVRVEAFDWTSDFDRSCGILLTEGNDPSSVGVVRVQNADSISCRLWGFGFVHEVGDGGGGAGKSQAEFSQHLRVYN